jgi:hypothetical protein
VRRFAGYIASAAAALVLSACATQPATDGMEAATAGGERKRPDGPILSTAPADAKPRANPALAKPLDARNPAAVRRQARRNCQRSNAAAHRSHGHAG